MIKQFVVAAMCFVAEASSVAPAPNTWRLDFYHTGGKSGEIFSVDKVVVEPLPWPGSAKNNIDSTGYGSYFFELRDTTGKVLFSRGYSPIYAEWISTGENETRNRTFQESLRFPALTTKADIVVFRRDDSNQFVEAWRTRIDPSDMFIDRSTPKRYEPIAVEKHGDPKDKVDILLLGDGYTAAECAAKFRKDTRRMADVFFSVEPYKSHRNGFNIWGLCPPSPKSGISRPSTGVHIDTPVGTTYDIFGSERYVLTMDNRAFRTIASNAPYEFVEILANSKTYGGGGLYNIFATVAVDNEWANYVFIHEFGHHFAALADEYYTSPVSYQPLTKTVEPWEPNATALLDRNNLKWKYLATLGTPVPTPWPKEQFETSQRGIQARRVKLRADRRPEAEMSSLFREERAFDQALFASAKYAKSVGAFQGANYDARAFYRPAIDCIMFSRNNVPFCPVCRHTIEGVIKSYTR